MKLLQDLKIILSFGAKLLFKLFIFSTLVTALLYTVKYLVILRGTEIGNLLFIILTVLFSYGMVSLLTYLLWFY